MKRSAKAIWKGSVKEGSGHLTTQSGTLSETQYSFKSRFEDGTGTNPEELMAAAHAGCFTMKLSAELTTAGFVPDSIETTSAITLEAGAIIRSDLVTTASVPKISEDEFQRIAGKAKEECPVSKAYDIEITLDATLAVGIS